MTGSQPSLAPTSTAPKSKKQHGAFGAIVAPRRWVRDTVAETFTKEQFISAFKSLLWVAPLTVLIWIYAERAQLTDLTNYPITVEVKNKDPKKLAILVTPPDGQISVDLSGPRAQLDALRDSLDPRAGYGPIVIEVPGDLPPGRHQIPSSLVSDEQRFESVSVDGSSPAYLEVMIDPIVEREVPVTVPPDVGTLADAPVFTPATVRVTGPQSAIEVAERGNELKVYADIASLKDIGTPGPHSVPNVRVYTEVSDKHVTIAPPSVSAALEVKRADATYKIPAVPVFVTAPPGLLDEFQVVLDETTLPVVVVGPEDQINLLKDPSYSFKPMATIQVSRDDAGNRPRTAKVKYVLPDGIKVKPDDAPATVGFRMVEREAAE